MTTLPFYTIILSSTSIIDRYKEIEAETKLVVKFGSLLLKRKPDEAQNAETKKKGGGNMRTYAFLTKDGFRVEVKASTPKSAYNKLMSVIHLSSKITKSYLEL